MINSVIGVKEFQINLPKISRQIAEEGGHYLITNRNKPAFVTIPFSDYQEIEDILIELNSPSLRQDIETGREEYQRGKTKTLDQILDEDE